MKSLLIAVLLVTAAAASPRHHHHEDRQYEVEEPTADPAEEETTVEPVDDADYTVEEEENKEAGSRGTGRSGTIKTEKSSTINASSSSQKETTTKVKLNAAPVQPVKPSVAQKVIKPVVEKAVVQPVVFQPAVQKVQSVIQQPLIQKPMTQKFFHQTALPQVTQLTQQQLIKQFGVAQDHIDVLPMSSGQYAVAVDDSQGRLVNYLSLGKQIQLVPQEVQGVSQYLFPAQDLITRHQSLVHLGSPNGHLVLSDFNVGGKLLRGFPGWDDFGQVMVPVHGESSKMVVENTIHRLS